MRMFYGLPFLTLTMFACASASQAIDPIPSVEAPPPTPVEVAPPAPPRPPGASPRRVPVAGVASLSLGEEHACVVRDDGKVLCWGNGATFRLGHGLLEASKAPVEVLGVERAVRVAAGGAMSCAIGRDGSAWCWGGYRQRPGDEDGVFWPLVRRPEMVAWPVSWTRQVGVGWVQAALLDGAGGLSILDAYLGPVALPAFAPAIAVASLRDGFCALTSDGRVQCVTSSEVGAAGNGGGEGGFGMEPAWVIAPLAASATLDKTLVDADGNPLMAPCATWEQESPTPPAFCKDTLTGARALDAHDDLACAVLADGGLACWGCAECWDDDPPPLGLPRGLVASIPFVISGVAGVREVAVGGRHLCTLHVDGAVRCWGDDAEGQLGPDGRGRSATPVTVPGLGEVVHIDAGEATTCALNKAGEVLCWGHELGTALPEPEYDPEPSEPEEDAGVMITERPRPDEIGERSTQVCREVDVFDASGELWETRYGYDTGGNRVVERRSRWSPSGLVPDRDVRYTRDRKGQVRRERITETREGGEVHESRIDYRRDAAGRVLWQKGRGTEDDGAVRFGYDARGRLVSRTTQWDGTLTLEWSERGGAPGTAFAGLTVFEAHTDSDLQYETLPGPLKLALDASGREVYRREQDEGAVLDSWRTFDAQGRLTELREERFFAPFFEDAIERWTTRYAYDATGRLIATEVFSIEPDGAALQSRTVHLYTDCITGPRRT